MNPNPLPSSAVLHTGNPRFDFKPANRRQYDTSASNRRRRMLTFTPPRWQPLGLPPHMSQRVDHSSKPTPTLASCLARPTPTSASVRSIPFHDPAHDKGDVQHRTRGHIRPRAVEALGASIRDNAPAAPGAFDPARGWEGEGGEATRDKVQLVLSLKAMGRRFEWRGALKVFRRAKEDGVVVDNSVYSCIIGVMAKSGRWSEAVQLLGQARNDGLEPNAYCFTAAVSACAKGRNWQLALSLLDQMRAAGLKPDHVTYGSAVSAMAKTGQWQRALELLRQMAGEGLRPNVVCYGAAVDACAKGGQWERAVNLLEEMRSAGVEPDRICYNTAVNACAQSGEWETALALVDEMRQAGDNARPDAFTLNSVMFGMASVGEWQLLLAVLDGMQAGGVAPDVVSYNTAMGACNKARQHRRALSIFEDMQAAGVTPDKESFSAAAEACASDTSGGLGARAVELLETAQKQGLKRPGARAVAATLAACIGGGGWRRAVPAVEKMLDASGRGAWDEVMQLLATVQVGRDRIKKRAAASTPPPPEDGVKADLEVASPLTNAQERRPAPRVNGFSLASLGTAVPPSEEESERNGTDVSGAVTPFTTPSAPPYNTLETAVFPVL